MFATHIHDLRTPALCVDGPTLARNLAAMAARLPGERLRPHVKAHLCTELARCQAAHGHTSFACATLREMHGMIRADIGNDLLLANETLDTSRVGGLHGLTIAAGEGSQRVTVAVDSEATIFTAAFSGIRNVLIDVNVGLPRCGCAPEEAGELAALARRKGLTVRGVMGYEGHAVGITDRAERERVCAESMELLRAAHAEVGGEIISAGGTGTFDCNAFATEIQAGSYALMDTTYAAQDLPFEQAAYVLATVISVTDRKVIRGGQEVAERYAVADAGLKCFGMDHGQPSVEGAFAAFCSDEHVTFFPEGRMPKVGERVRVRPAHIDPTVAYHTYMYVVDGERVLENWRIDLRR